MSPYDDKNTLGCCYTEHALHEPCEERPKSNTQGLIDACTDEMGLMLCDLLEVRDQEELDCKMRIFEWKAHERLLAIRYENARLAAQPPPIGVLVTTQAKQEKP